MNLLSPTSKDKNRKLLNFYKYAIFSMVIILPTGKDIICRKYCFHIIFISEDEHGKYSFFDHRYAERIYQ